MLNALIHRKGNEQIMKTYTNVYINGGNHVEKGGYHSFPTGVIGLAVDYNEDKYLQFVLFDGRAQFIKNEDLEVIHYD